MSINLRVQNIIFAFVFITLLVSLVSIQYLNFFDNVNQVPTQQSETDSNIQFNDNHCLFNCDYLVTGQDKDGIPSIDDPIYNETPTEETISSSAKVLGIVIGNQPIAYSYNILDWHEIVNDIFDGVHFSITYCPLTATGMLFKTEVLENSQLGVSGKLYENNLVFYDRNTESYWSQMMQRGVKGDLLGEFIEPDVSIETTWEAWISMYPNTWLLSEETGYDRDYERYPYGNYRTDSSIYFPSSYDPTIFPFNLFAEKDLVHVVNVDREKALIPFQTLDRTQILNFELNGLSLVTFYSIEHQTPITYIRPELEGVVLNFALNSNTQIAESLSYGLPTFFDSVGNIWNMKGEMIDGNLLNLKPITAFNAFWFAASVFYYNALIFTVDGVPTRVNSYFTPEYTPQDNVEFPIISLILVMLVPILTIRRRVHVVDG